MKFNNIYQSLSEGNSISSLKRTLKIAVNVAKLFCISLKSPRIKPRLRHNNKIDFYPSNKENIKCLA